MVARIEWLPIACEEPGGGDTELNEAGVVRAVVEFTIFVSIDLPIVLVISALDDGK